MLQFSHVRTLISTCSNLLINYSVLSLSHLHSLASSQPLPELFCSHFSLNVRLPATKASSTLTCKHYGTIPLPIAPSPNHSHIHTRCAAARCQHETLLSYFDFFNLRTLLVRMQHRNVASQHAIIRVPLCHAHTILVCLCTGQYGASPHDIRMAISNNPFEGR